MSIFKNNQYLKFISTTQNNLLYYNIILNSETAKKALYEKYDTIFHNILKNQFYTQCDQNYEIKISLKKLQDLNDEFFSKFSDDNVFKEVFDSFKQLPTAFLEDENYTNLSLKNRINFMKLSHNANIGLKEDIELNIKNNISEQLDYYFVVEIIFKGKLDKINPEYKIRPIFNMAKKHGEFNFLSIVHVSQMGHSYETVMSFLKLCYREDGLQ